MQKTEKIGWIRMYTYYYRRRKKSNQKIDQRCTIKCIHVLVHVCVHWAKNSIFLKIFRLIQMKMHLKLSQINFFNLNVNIYDLKKSLILISLTESSITNLIKLIAKLNQMIIF